MDNFYNESNVFGLYQCILLTDFQLNMDEYARSSAYDKLKNYLIDIKSIESVLPLSKDIQHTNDVYYLYD